jgi:hypothetical protein
MREEVVDREVVENSVHPDVGCDKQKTPAKHRYPGLALDAAAKA